MVFGLVPTQDQDLENQTHGDDCAICMCPNDDTSTKLSCGCNSKYHAKCQQDLKSNGRLDICPVCRRSIVDDHFTQTVQPIQSTQQQQRSQANNAEFDRIVSCCAWVLIILVLILGYMFYLGYMIIGIGNLIIASSRVNYCDNKYRKCPYFPTDGLLVYNTIDTEVDGFDVKYSMTSYYNWTKGDDEVYTCKVGKPHIYDSYDNALVASTETVGYERTIFVDWSDYHKCRLHYSLYNPAGFYFHSSCLLSLCLTFVFWVYACIYVQVRASVTTRQLNFREDFVGSMKSALVQGTSWIIDICLIGSMVLVHYCAAIYLY